MSAEDWDYCSKKALELFTFGQKVVKQHGTYAPRCTRNEKKYASGSGLKIQMGVSRCRFDSQFFLSSQKKGSFI